jgi:hypothetical protein
MPESVSDKIWDSAEAVSLDFVWENSHPSPYKTEARMLHTEDCVAVKMTTDEWPLRVTTMELNGSICTDSCMEFFFTPNTVDADYLNVEINPAGVSLVCIGEGRPNRKRLDITGEGIVIETRIKPLGGWELMLFIPFGFMNKYFSKVEKVFRANFYKCGDLTVVPHYSTWSPVVAPKPDYHRPECFGRIVLS